LVKNIDAVKKVLDSLVEPYELIIIDDKSQDRTAALIELEYLGKEDVRCVFHEKNVGRGGTVREGLLMSQARYAGFVDIDLEVDAVYINDMIEALKSGSDAAIGCRYYDLIQPGGKLRAILSLAYRIITKWYLRISIKDTEAGYKFFNMESCREVIAGTKNDKWFWDTEIVYNLVKNKKKIAEVPCVFIRNIEKQSTVKLVPDIIEYIKAIAAFKK